MNLPYSYDMTWSDTEVGSQPSLLREARTADRDPLWDLQRNWILDSVRPIPCVIFPASCRVRNLTRVSTTW